MSSEILFYPDEETHGIVIDTKSMQNEVADLNTQFALILASLDKAKQPCSFISMEPRHYNSMVSTDISITANGDVTCSTIPGSHSLWHNTQHEWTMVCDSPVIPPGHSTPTKNQKAEMKGIPSTSPRQQSLAAPTLCAPSEGEAPSVEIEWDSSNCLADSGTTDTHKPLSKLLLAPPVRRISRRPPAIYDDSDASISCPSISFVDSPVRDTSAHWYADSPAYPPIKCAVRHTATPTALPELACSPSRISNNPVPLLRLAEGSVADIDDVMGPLAADISVFSDVTAFFDVPLCKRPITEKVKKKSLAKRLKNFTKRFHKLAML